MSRWKKWWPFRFRRGERKVPVNVSTSEPHPEMGASTALAAPGDPFREIEHIMHRWWGDPFGEFPLPASFFADVSPARFAPAVDLVDEGSHLRVSAELPGVARDDLRVEVEDDVLTIRGEKRHEASSREEGVYRVERSFGSFVRTLPLPPDVDAARAEATYSDGVLNVRLPKTEAATPTHRRIRVE